VTISLPKRGLPAPTNHQIPVLTKQVPDLVEITTEMEHVIRKKVFLLQKENLIQADRSPVTHLCVVLRVAAHSRVEVQMADRREILETMSRPVKGKAFPQEGKPLIQAGRPQKTGQKEVLAIDRRVKRKVFLQEGKRRTQANRHQKAD
jgi:hypothetical protein